MEGRLQTQKHTHPQGKPAPFSGRKRWIRNIKRVLSVFGVAAFLVAAALFAFDRYVWLSHGKNGDYLQIQECIETGKIDGDEQKCMPFFKEATTPDRSGR